MDSKIHFEVPEYILDQAAVHFGIDRKMLRRCRKFNWIYVRHKDFKLRGDRVTLGKLSFPIDMDRMVVDNVVQFSATEDPHVFELYGLLMTPQEAEEIKVQCTPEGIAKTKEMDIQRRKQREIESREAAVELNIKTLSQEEVISIIDERRDRFHLTREDTLKALLVCVSHDEDMAEQPCIDIIDYVNPDEPEIEFFVINPDPYGPPRQLHNIWVDRDHYFQLPFGDVVDQNDHPDYHRLLEAGPFDFIIYMHCAIYGKRREFGVGLDVEEEGKLLNTLMKPDSVLVIKPFHHIPKFAILAFQKMGMETIGQIKTNWLSLGMLMKRL